MNTQLIPVFTGELSGTPVQLVDARLLHSFLEVATQFKDWIARRIEEYGFIDGQDFRSFLSGTKGRPAKDYHLSIDMAKELGMIERNAKGRQIRRYFLEMERIALQGKEPPKPSIETYQVKVLTTFTRGDEPTQQIVPYNSCVVDGENPKSVNTFIREYVSSTPEMLSALSSAYITKLMNCQDAAIKQQSLPLAEKIAAPLAKTPSTTTSLIDQFIHDWKNIDKPVINAPFIPCLGTQALRLFHVWAQNKGIIVRLGNNHIMSDLYQHHGFYKSRVRVSAKSGTNQRTVLMIDGITSPSGMTATDWIADCIDKMEDALIWMEIP